MKDMSLPELTEESRKWRQRVGRLGESIAASALSETGWTILERNWRAGRYAELDIIAVNPDDVLVFIEVKTRRCAYATVDALGSAFDAISPRKQAKIRNSALCFLLRNGWCAEAYRFDVIVICCHGDVAPTLIHIENAFS